MLKDGCVILAKSFGNGQVNIQLSEGLYRQTRRGGLALHEGHPSLLTGFYFDRR